MAKKRKTFEYRLLPFDNLVDLLRQIEPPKDSYLSEDGFLKAYKSTIQQGFRWVWTEGDWAVFERKIEKEETPCQK